MIDVPPGPSFWAALWSEILPKTWVYWAACAGALTGILVEPTASIRQRVIGFMIGLWAALFVAPLLISHFMPNASAESKEAACLYYGISVLANSVLPAILKRARRWVAEGSIPFINRDGAKK